MKLKVGDKLKRIKESSSYFTKGRFYEIARVLEKDVQFIDNNGILHFWPIDELHEAFEIKQSKNQRITALEKEVAELKKILNEIQNGRKTMRDTIEEVLSEPSATDEIIEFEGNQYRKVDREARERDLVVFKRENDYYKSGKPYQVLSNVQFVDEDGDEQDVYNVFNRKPQYVDVYELIKQELTPNQQRAEIIEKAKKFVEEQKNRYGHYEIYDEKGVSRKCIADFKFNVEKRTIVVLLRGFESNKIYIRGIAKCFPLDVFNEHIGKAIALGRALGLDVSEFEQAVQPNEVVVGQIVVGNNSGETYEVQEFHDRVKLGGEFGRSIAINGLSSSLWIGTKQVTIINDTNAQYEEVK